MAITINIYYKGENGNAERFAQEMIASGTVDEIRAEEGNLRYEYSFPMQDRETLLRIDSWESERALEVHHHSSMMQKIIAPREKYDLHMTVEKYVSADAENGGTD